MRRFIVAAMALALAALPAMGAEATFERNLSVNGQVDLTVSTGSGNIHISQGADNQVHIFGRVRSHWNSNEDRVREIAAHPPIQQTGNVIRIGAHRTNMRNISIDYEIQAPANAFLQASSGSGNIHDTGVGESAKLSTGSGNIHATGLRGDCKLNTGSGNIYAEQSSKGDMKAQTGSGNIELRDIQGGLRAGTGSGGIKVSGSPLLSWTLHTGSGNVEIWPGNTGFDLDASTGSGGIHTDRDMMTHGSNNRHHVVGKIGGGGPTVRIETGSGGIRVH